MARFDRLNNQSPAQTAYEYEGKNVGRSAHDLSFIHNGNALIGALIPVAVYETVPNQDFDISLSAVLEFRNPTTRQLFNGMRVYFHCYYNRLVDLWEGAKNWLDNGRTGKVQLNRPNLIYQVFDDFTDPNDARIVNALTPMSLLNYFGLPPVVTHPSNFPPLRSFQAFIGHEGAIFPYDENT